MDPLYVGGAVFAAGIVARALYTLCSGSEETKKNVISKKKKSKKKRSAKEKTKLAKKTDELSAFIAEKADPPSKSMRKRKKNTICTRNFGDDDASIIHCKSRV